jgi:thioredoxin-related protein
MKLFPPTRFALTAAALLCINSVFAGEEGWSTDYEAARREAANSDKVMLINFTGSESCAYCIQLHDEIFQKEVFKRYAKDKFVLLELDYPLDKSKQSAATIGQNQMLMDKYGVQGFPTILLADAKGLPFATTAYKPGGAESYVKMLDALLANKKTRDEGFIAAEKAEGVEKAKLLFTVLETMKLNEVAVANFYDDAVAQIRKSDPTDETGFGKKMAAKERMNQYDEDLFKFRRQNDYAGALALTEEKLKEDLEPVARQRVMTFKARILGVLGKFDDAVKTLEDAKAVSPVADMVEFCDDLIRQMKESKAAAKDVD